MLSLKTTASERWTEHAQENLFEILVDHAHCEKKAASCAMNLIFAYVENRRLVNEMTVIVNEQLEHFHALLDLLEKRGIEFRRLRPSKYGPQLNEHIRKPEPDRAIDRLIVAGLIEARSCERIDRLRQLMETKDAELVELYTRLYDSKKRHHQIYVELAKEFGPEQMVKERLHELSEIETEVTERGDNFARLHG